MSTTQEDYFGEPVDDEKPRRRHHRRRRHHSPSDDDSDISPTEVVHEEKEYKRPGHKHKIKETVDTTYRTASPDSDADTDEVSSDENRKRRRRRRHRHHRREKVPDEDYVAAAAAAPSQTDTDTDGESARSRSPVGLRERSKNIGESAFAALGLDDTIKNLRDRSKSRGRRHSVDSDEGYDSSSERRARSRSRMGSNTAQAAILAAAVEAFRARKEPGGVTGSSSMKRIVEAALASGAVEKFLGRKDGDDDKNSTRHIAEAVLAGLAAQRGVNGPRRKSRSRHDSHHPIRDLAASGLIAAAGKKALDYQRARSQSRGRGDRPGLDRKRSHSVGDVLATVGLGGLAANSLSKDRDRDQDRDRRSRSRSEYDINNRQINDNYNRQVGFVDNRNRRARGSKRPGIKDDDSSSSDSLSDSDLELDEEGERKRHKTLRQQEIIGIALAIIATLHLGHAGYEAKEKRRERREALESGKITKAEEEKMKIKSKFSDLATVSLAVLAAAEAVKSWKKMQSSRKQCHEFDKKRDKIAAYRKQKALQNGSAYSSGTNSPVVVAAPVVPAVNTVPAGEASKYYAPGYMGPPPGAKGAPIPAYPYYPTSGQIPVTRGADSYSTRDGRSIPVVYPSSVTPA